MAYMTDRKRAAGMGSAKSGTQHHWHMMISSVALAGLIPLFIFTFGSIYGAPYEDVVAYYQRPFPAIVALLTIAVGFIHFRGGVQTLIEDYVHGTAKKVAIIAMICLSYTAAAAGVLAVASLAL
ncbi:MULTISPECIES: succinate dehydrogenase, hydrophobic membrane anchor protein [Loktanella]|jgi:succinate dehydrogenase / fumarate reductase membrane anchor subunit|uniref:Succinate dehydrogenase hydrophobic membrane anchor subunit n=1 Tax=Loktanella salsilacus TaxID=195913 RepID=A0A1I4G536_9RHOB|nr:succinate dehydrogenase, hydrophobic membrane anchor protein [Loktanella salsilacus]MBU0780404.1 succinate dehydrogenase, hydrophobic membrane anchor protein [Alphaproteobacteria bacterium]MBU1836609.1 succinate dehydrogenase, hydrophobic membrane anchor protein [Alphaproteobacteria bacterium]UTH44788.1 succinate dehydrogenase, hydrophobic membrane anchor protein [Loktanella salsilacus]UTH48513.1 succinate dehydrogenase, hydrophobic membrane anchor protein [Loktanella salsilacus]SFL24226.1 |tara:strand:+ start:2279 stop:2650 length:372 start_codon:yes stop_codon:yes gene_type:complete